MRWHKGSKYDAGAHAAQVAPCKNRRQINDYHLLPLNASSCLAPGLFRAADVLLKTTQQVVARALHELHNVGSGVAGPSASHSELGMRACAITACTS